MSNETSQFDAFDPDVLLSYIEGQLPADQRRELEAKLADLPEARMLLSQMQDDREQLSASPKPKAPPHLVEDLLQKLERDMLLGEMPGSRTPAPALKLTADEPVTPSTSPVKRSRWRIGYVAIYTGLAAALLLCAGVVLQSLTDVSLLERATQLAMGPSPQLMDQPSGQQFADAGSGTGAGSFGIDDDDRLPGPMKGSDLAMADTPAPDSMFRGKAGESTPEFKQGKADADRDQTSSTINTKSMGKVAANAGQEEVGTTQQPVAGPGGNDPDPTQPLALADQAQPGDGQGLREPTGWDSVMARSGPSRQRDRDALSKQGPSQAGAGTAGENQAGANQLLEDQVATDVTHDVDGRSAAGGDVGDSQQQGQTTFVEKPKDADNNTDTFDGMAGLNAQQRAERMRQVAREALKLAQANQAAEIDDIAGITPEAPSAPTPGTPPGTAAPTADPAPADALDASQPNATADNTTLANVNESGQDATPDPDMALARLEDGPARSKAGGPGVREATVSQRMGRSLDESLFSQQVVVQTTGIAAATKAELKLWADRNGAALVAAPDTPQHGAVTQVPVPVNQIQVLNSQAVGQADMKNEQVFTGSLNSAVAPLPTPTQVTLELSPSQVQGLLTHLNSNAQQHATLEPIESWQYEQANQQGKLAGQADDSGTAGTRQTRVSGDQPQELGYQSPEQEKRRANETAKRMTDRLAAQLPVAQSDPLVEHKQAKANDDPVETEHRADRPTPVAPGPGQVADQATTTVQSQPTAEAKIKLPVWIINTEPSQFPIDLKTAAKQIEANTAQSNTSLEAGRDTEPGTAAETDTPPANTQPQSPQGEASNTPEPTEPSPGDTNQ